MKSKVRVASLRRHNDRLKSSSFETYRRFLETLFRSSNSAIASDFLTLLEKEDWKALVELAESCSSKVYPTASEHRLATQFSSVIRKYPFPSDRLNLDARGRALETFLVAEHRCKRVNQRFALYRKVRSPHESYLHDMISWIRHVIGNEPPLACLSENCRFGPGASIGVNGSKTSFGRKMLAQEWTVSSSAYYLARSVLKDDFHFFELLVKEPCREFFSVDEKLFDFAYHQRTSLVENNKITFVPKTVTTERTIAVEPLLNGYLQLGVESFMRKRLKRANIDITDQSRNQKLAREGSFPSQDPYVTIDLSAASDSISTELVRYILPPDWFYLLDQLRSRNYLLDGSVHPFNKFVTMGNGFCFPLETLIFASVVEAVSKDHSVKPDYSVYGDDIICRQSLAADVISLLGICGFKTNLKKTHLTGPFRESCGADWYEGEDVRPITLDYAFDSVENIIKFCNLLRSKDYWRVIFDEASEFLTSLIPPEHFYCRPYSGRVDGALEVPFDVFMASPHARFRIETQSWSWLEIVKSPHYDYSCEGIAGYPIALIAGALRGIKPREGLTRGSNSPSPFTERRRSRTKIRRESYCGTSSNWVPPGG